MIFKIKRNKPLIENIVREYTYYDGLLSYTRQQGDFLEYCHCIGEEDRIRVYLIMRVTAERIAQAERGDIDLRTMMMEPEFPNLSVETGNVVSVGYTLADVIEEFSIDVFPRSGSMLMD